MWQKLILLAAAGGLGSLARYGLAGFVQNWSRSETFPYGTLAVNLLGSLAFGLIAGVCEERFIVSPQTRIIVLTGFIGAFTTFSTLMFETARLLEDAQYLMAFSNLAAHNVLGLAALFAGLMLGRMI